MLLASHQKDGERLVQLKHHQRAHQREQIEAVGDINVTPLIDVVLVLLIIYMVVTPIMLNQLKVEMPEKEEEVPEGP